jgi:hypothetical protein
MAYSEFTLERVKREFNLKTFEKSDIFADVPELEGSKWLTETLQYYQPIVRGSNSEKARSELIITPILVDFRRQLNEQGSLFSGIDFSVDDTKGLNGVCDFLISKSTEVLMVTAPVIIIVEAKKENINAGLGQCIAEMVAARIFNERTDYQIPAIYGTVTTGTNWQFLKLEGDIIYIDLSEYYLTNVNKILGILASAV